MSHHSSSQLVSMDCDGKRVVEVYLLRTRDNKPVLHVRDIVDFLLHDKEVGDIPTVAEIREAVVAFAEYRDVLNDDRYRETVLDIVHEWMPFFQAVITAVVDSPNELTSTIRWDSRISYVLERVVDCIEQEMRTVLEAQSIANRTEEFRKLLWTL